MYKSTVKTPLVVSITTDMAVMPEQPAVFRRCPRFRRHFDHFGGKPIKKLSEKRGPNIEGLLSISDHIPVLELVGNPLNKARIWKRFLLTNIDRFC